MMVPPNDGAGLQLFGQQAQCANRLFLARTCVVQI